MKSNIAAAVALISFAALVSARQCQNLTIPIHAQARNGVFDINVPSNNADITDFLLNFVEHANYSDTLLSGYKTVEGKYNIAATYCQPDNGPGKVLQILTHGIGFDRSYWDFSYNNYNYSYVNAALDAGYSTFSWDRLGIGESSHGNPLTDIQNLLEVDALRALTVKLRQNSIQGINHKFSKIIHIGHSLGSEHTYALTAMYPTISDGITLTGFSQNGSFLGDYALGANLIEASQLLPNYTPGYMVSGDTTGVQIGFFAPGDFDIAAVHASFATQQPVTLGELLTVVGEAAAVNKFSGPVHIVTGEHDIIYCGGTCTTDPPPAGYPNIPSTSKQYFTNASNFETTIVAGAGHGFNLGYSHAVAYPIIMNYLANNGLGSGST